MISCAGKGSIDYKFTTTVLSTVPVAEKRRYGELPPVTVFQVSAGRNGTRAELREEKLGSTIPRHFALPPARVLLALRCVYRIPTLPVGHRKVRNYQSSFGLRSLDVRQTFGLISHIYTCSYPTLAPFAISSHVLPSLWLFDVSVHVHVSIRSTSHLPFRHAHHA